MERVEIIRKVFEAKGQRCVTQHRCSERLAFKDGSFGFAMAIAEEEQSEAGGDST